MELVTENSSEYKVLRLAAKNISFPISTQNKSFVAQFTKFFNSLASPFGKPAGLAAPQVGVSKKIIIIQIPPEARKIRLNVYDTLPQTVFINPLYTPIENAGKSKDWEACYSVPDKMGEIYRYNEIYYEAYKPNGEKVSGIAKGFLARLLQHEIGHLNGDLYIDHICANCRIGPMKEMMALRLEELKNTLKH